MTVFFTFLSDSLQHNHQVKDVLVSNSFEVIAFDVSCVPIKIYYNISALAYSLLKPFMVMKGRATYDL